MNNHLRSIRSAVTAVAVSLMAIPAFANVGGFVDTQIYFAGATDEENSPTFRVNDGAVYLSKELGKGKVMVDIPFMYSGMGTNNSFALATGKAQAYVTQNYDMGIGWSLGQFDTPFGIESNDSVGWTLSNRSFLSAALPITHTGWSLWWAGKGWEVKALIANGLGKGLRNGDNFEFGGLVKYNADAFYVGAGYLHHKPVGGTESSMFADFMAGTKVADIGMDLEVMLTKAAIAAAETGFGVAGHFTWEADKMWGLALRPEYLSKVTARGATAAGANSVFGVTFGPHFNMTDDLKVRADWRMASTKLLSGSTATTNHEATLSAVYKW